MARAGVKPATIRDVASRAAVSVASVSRVLNGAGPVARPTRERVLEAVEALSYVPHSGARSLSTRRTDTIGVILPDLHGEFFSELIRGFDIAARGRGLHLIVSSSHDDAEEATAALRSMRGRVDGVVLMSPHLDASRLAEGAGLGLPIMLMNGPGSANGALNLAIDNEGGAHAATRHLLDGGARDIAHIRGPAGNREADAREAGYRRAMHGAGLPARIETGDFTQVSGYRVMARMLAARRPDGVFAANDATAIGALLAIRDAGLNCPDDIALIGFDDVPMAALVTPALTTMQIDIAELGGRALARLADVVQSRDGAGDAVPSSEIVRPLLVVRQSTHNSHSGDRPAEPAPIREERHNA